MSISIYNDEINYLIYKYLLESGHSHSAFSLKAEANIDTSKYKDVQIAPGALISLLEKSLLFQEVEVHVMNNKGTRQCNQGFTLLGQHKCDFSEPKISQAKSKNEFLQLPEIIPVETQICTTEEISENNLSKNHEIIHFASRKVKHLRGHMDKVIDLKWFGDNLVTLDEVYGRIWKQFEVLAVLPHINDSEETPQATCVSVGQNLIATGCSDGFIRLWSTKDGSIQQIIKEHTGVIKALEWNSSKEMIAAGGSDGKLILWQQGQGSKVINVGVQLQDVS